MSAGDFEVAWTSAARSLGCTAPARGDYRVIYRIDTERRRVDVVAVEHRADVYRRR